MTNLLMLCGDIANIYCESVLNTQITQCGKMQEFLNAAISSFYTLPPGFKRYPNLNQTHKCFVWQNGILLKLTVSSTSIGRWAVNG